MPEPVLVSIVHDGVVGSPNVVTDPFVIDHSVR